MNVDDLLQRFGLRVNKDDLPEIRQLLMAEARREAEGSGDTEVVRLAAIQLFSAGLVEDVLPIWRAKQASFDASCSIDVQFLCGAGLAETKQYLATCVEPEAASALKYLEDCEAAGDFEDFSPEAQLIECERFYGGDA